MSKENKNLKIGADESVIAFHVDDNKEVLKISRDGVITWFVDGEEKVCKDFKDLAKAFLYTLFALSPQTDWREVAPKIYEEIKHLIKENQPEEKQMKKASELVVNDEIIVAEHHIRITKVSDRSNTGWIYFDIVDMTDDISGQWSSPEGAEYQIFNKK